MANNALGNTPTTGWRRPRGPAEVAWDPLLIACAVMMLTYVWRFQQLYAVFRIVPLTRLATLVAFGLWIVDPNPRRMLNRILVTRPMRLIVALGVIIVLSVPTGVYPTNSISFITGEYVTTFLMMLFIAGAVRGWKDVERLVLVHVVGALVYMVWALSRSGIGGGLRGLTYYDQNDIALLLAATMPMAVYFMRRGMAPKLRAMAAVTVGLSFLVIQQAGSRGGFLSVVVVVTYMLFRFHSIPVRFRVGAVIFGTVLMLVLGTDEYWSRIRSMFNPSQDYNWVGNSNSGRMEIWKRGMGYMVSSPFGVGIGQFSVAEGFSEVSRQLAAEGRGFKWSAPHSIFVQVAGELGVGGLVIFVVLLGGSIRYLAAYRAPRRAGREEVRRAALGQAIAGGLVAYVVGGAFLSHAYSAYLYSLFGLTIAAYKLDFDAERARRRAARAQVAQSPPQPLRRAAPAPGLLPPPAPVPSTGTTATSRANGIR